MTIFLRSTVVKRPQPSVTSAAAPPPVKKPYIQNKRDQPDETDDTEQPPYKMTLRPRH